MVEDMAGLEEVGLDAAGGDVHFVGYLRVGVALQVQGDNSGLLW